MNIAVIFGGESCEHDISIITGEQLISKCNEYLYNIYPVYIDRNGTWLTGKTLKDIDVFSGNLKGVQECGFLPNDNTLYVKHGKKYKCLCKIDVAFVCLHGLRGEDGAVSGVLELSKIPYTVSSMCASAVCLDKSIFKLVAKGLGIDVVEGVSITESEYTNHADLITNEIANLGFPVIIKPSRLGSSIGIEICDSLNDLDNKLENAFNYDKKLLIEKFVDVEKEVNIAIINDKDDYIISTTEEPVTSDIILSFDNKYRKSPQGFETIKRIVPANITKAQSNKIVLMATRLYKELEMFGVVRFDFIISKKGDVFINEVNTIPGSMANYLFDKDKYSYPELIEILISNAVFRKENDKSLKKIFDSGVLKSDFDGFKK